MIDIAVKGLVKAFEVDKNILDGLTFDINEGEHVGLLGKNGAGKTTLFRIIVGEIEADEGEVVLGTSKKTGLISQIPIYPEAFTTEDVLKTAHRRQYDIKAEMERLERLMAESAQVEAGAYDKLALEFDTLGGYEIEYERNKVANGLDIKPAMRSQLFKSLSGGEKTRVNLARLILEKTDILLLDEPTNHLDMRSTEWLEDYLQKFKGTVLIISHDRYFLDRAVTRIIEVRNGKAEFYSGNYSFYAEEKQARYDEQLKRYEQQEKEAKRLEEAADRLYQWGTGNKKLMQKSFAIKKRVERLRQLDRPEKEKQIRSSFYEKDFHSDELLTIKNLSKSFSDKVLFHDIELSARGGERIALLGDNGTGKTTFLRILLGMEPCDKGFIKIGPAVKCAYLPQVVHFQRPELTVLDTLIAETGLTPQSARNRLGAFKFSGENVFKPVSVLSGGEKSRLRLCILMNESINLLVLDEPTNHLDIDSREWIESALEDYEEALLFVSHDRYFIDRFATRIWALEDGTINDYPCDFEAYRKLKDQLLKKEQRKKEQKRKAKTRTARPQKEAVSIEKQILAIEEKQKELALLIEENATDYIALSELFDERERLESELLTLYDSWEEQVNA
ncbi:MAG: ABC-F family ATP-binding cassette domain-containing protein [Clostridiales bacterium]|jgi:ATPase subunit of ABC transporter with duplicated ATPase domains|nr:ABC-F family ATP-binding cassette domain-containing protein [Clostridiales bacterium]